MQIECEHGRASLAGGQEREAIQPSGLPEAGAGRQRGDSAGRKEPRSLSLTREAVLGVAPVALHPGEGQPRQVVHGGHGSGEWLGDAAGHGSVCRHSDHAPGRVEVISVHGPDPDVEVVGARQRSHAAGAAVAVAPGGGGPSTAGGRAVVATHGVVGTAHHASSQAVVRRVLQPRVGDHAAALVRVIQDLVDSKANGLGVALVEVVRP